MQKRANHQPKSIVYAPIPFRESALCYTDPAPVPLPCKNIEVLHHHDCIELGLCLSGSGIFLFGDRVVSLSAGDALFIPPAIYHYSQVISEKPCICAFLYLRQNLLQERFQIEGLSPSRLLAAHPSPLLFRQGDTPIQTALLRRILESAREKNDTLCGLQALELLMTMPADDTAPLDAVYHTARDPISFAADHMALHYRESLSNQALAALCHLSESQFRRRFTRIYGQPPHAYLNRLRCRIGAQMLRYTTRTIEDVAASVGFATPSDFYRHFKDCFSLSPSEWRKNHTPGA